jgi:hypothetical protein
VSKITPDTTDHRYNVGDILTQSSWAEPKMITVRWEFVTANEWDMTAAQRIVDRIQTRFQRAIGGLRCPVHGSEPLLVVQGGSVADLDVDLETCCERLAEESNARIQAGSHRARAFGSRTTRERRRSIRF